jgi:hypothetical protein
MIREYRDDELRNSVAFPDSVKEAIRKSCVDQNFKNHLLSQPTETLRSRDFNLPPGVAVEVLQDTDEVLHLVLPFNAMSSETDLSDAVLAAIVGGGRKRGTAMSGFS